MTLLFSVFQRISRICKYEANNIYSTNYYYSSITQHFNVVSHHSKFDQDKSQKLPKLNMEVFKFIQDGEQMSRLGQWDVVMKKSDSDPGTGTVTNNSYPYTVQTPMYFIHTVAGSIPHITPEVLQIVYGSNIIPPIQLSIDSMHTLVGCIGPSKLSLSKFVGLPMCPTFLAVNNPLTNLPQQFNDKAGIAVWTRLGRETLSSTKFIDIISEFQPNFFQVMSDYSISKESSKKRIKKSLERSLEYADKTFEKIGNEESSKAYASLEIDWFLNDEKEAYRALSTLLENRNHITGFFINGIFDQLYNNSQEEQDGNIDESEVLKVLSTLISHLPKEKPRYCAGPFDPLSVLELVKHGIDQFDSSYVTQLSDNGKALAFPLSEFVMNGSTVNNETIVTTREKECDYNAEQNSKMAGITLGNNKDECVENPNIILDLNDKRYFDDFKPLVHECKCYTCRKYARSYIHHLLTTKELLGRVLLMGHNLFHFERFFVAIRHCLQNSINLKNLQESLTISNINTKLPKNSLKNYAVTKKL